MEKQTSPTRRRARSNPRRDSTSVSLDGDFTDSMLGDSGFEEDDQLLDPVDVDAGDHHDGHAHIDSDVESTFDGVESLTSHGPSRVGSGQSAGPSEKLTFKEMASLSCYWFGWATLWIPLMVVIIPKQVHFSTILFQ